MRVVPAILVAGVLAAPAAAAEPSIHDLSIVADGVQILVSFALGEGFTPELLERIESGLPTSLVYKIEFKRDRKRWWDDGLESARLEVVTMFNAITREFLVNTKLEGRLIDSRTLRDPGDLERAMTRFTALPVFTLEEPSPRERYLVRVRVELGTGQWLGFIPVLRTTDWVESNKIRIQPAP
jgi:hypothetical protein